MNIANKKKKIMIGTISRGPNENNHIKTHNIIWIGYVVYTEYIIWHISMNVLSKISIFIIFALARSFIQIYIEWLICLYGKHK